MIMASQWFCCLLNSVADPEHFDADPYPINFEKLKNLEKLRAKLNENYILEEFLTEPEHYDVDPDPTKNLKLKKKLL